VDTAVLLWRGAGCGWTGVQGGAAGTVALILQRKVGYEHRELR